MSTPREELYEKLTHARLAPVVPDYVPVMLDELGALLAAVRELDYLVSDLRADGCLGDPSDLDNATAILDVLDGKAESS